MKAATRALICLTEFSLSAPQADAIVIYDCVAILAGVIGEADMQAAASGAAAAIRAADDSQLEFRQLLEEGGKERADDSDRGNGDYPEDRGGGE
jgi:hypothetical protein